MVGADEKLQLDKEKANQDMRLKEIKEDELLEMRKEESKHKMMIAEKNANKKEAADK